MNAQCEKRTGTTGGTEYQCALPNGHLGSHWVGQVGYFRWEPPVGELPEDIEEAIVTMQQRALDVEDPEDMHALHGATDNLRSVIQSHIRPVAVVGDGR